MGCAPKPPVDRFEIRYEGGGNVLVLAREVDAAGRPLDFVLREGGNEYSGTWREPREGGNPPTAIILEPERDGRERKLTRVDDDRLQPEGGSVLWRVVELTEADDGRSIRIGIGQPLEIRLPADPASGLRWVYSEIPDPPVAREGESRFVQTGGGAELFRFRGARFGVQPLTFNLRRPGESDGPPERSLTIILAAT